MARVLFIFDEARQLGRMRELQNIVSLLRGYEVSSWWFWQDIDQVRECFPEPSEFWSNMDVQTYHGLNDYTSAEAISKRLGEATIQVLSHQEGTSWSKPATVAFEQPQAGSLTTSRNVSTSEVARHLLKPDEVLNLPRSCFLAFVSGTPPICGELVRYYNAPEFRRGRYARPQPIGLRAGLRALSVLLLSCLYGAGVGAFALGLHETPPVMTTPEAPAQASPTGMPGRYGEAPQPFSGRKEKSYGSTRQPYPRTAGYRSW